MKKFIILLVVGVFLAVGSAVYAEENTNNNETQRELEQKRVELQREAQKVREEMRDEIEKKGRELRDEVQQKREEVRTEVQNIVASGTSSSAEVLRELQQKRLEIQNEIKTKWEAFKDEVQQKRVEVQTQIKTQREELQKQVQKIKDERKQQIVLSLGDRFTELNKNITDKLLATAERLQTILGKIESRGSQIQTGGVDVSTLTNAISGAKNAIQSAQDAIKAQAAKTYPITISADGTNPQLDAVKVRQALQTDLGVVRTTIQSARDAVQKAAQTLSQLAPAEGNESTSTATSTQ